MKGTQNIRIILIVIIVIVAVAAAFWFLHGRGAITHNNGQNTSNADRGVSDQPLDVALDFYGAWLDARRSTSTDPYDAGLQNNKALSVELSQKLSKAESTVKRGGFDPVLCQIDVPTKVTGKPIFVKKDSAQIMVLTRGTDTGTQAVANLTGKGGIWMITSITCGQKEQAPDTGEYNFDKKGQMLKQSLKDAKHWNLVFEQDGVMGYTAPLLFDDTSVCSTQDGTEKPCTDDLFYEPIKVHVQGDMTEAGVDVKKLQVLDQSTDLSQKQ